MSLKSYCEENDRQRILDEWDTEKNLPITPDRIAHTSSIPVWWRCEKGHSWCTQVQSRSRSSTGCPVCREEKLEEKRQRKLEEARIKYLSCKSSMANEKSNLHNGG